jgi:hypothetical protein
MIEHQLKGIERGGSSLPVYDEALGRPSGGAGPVERSFLIRPELPCVSCSHADVCAIKPIVEHASIEYRTPTSPDPSITIKVDLRIECEHYLAGAIAEPAPVYVAPSPKIQVTSSQRGAAASKTMRADGTAGSSVGSLSTIASRPRTAGEKIAASWTPEMREAARQRRLSQIAAKKVGA